MKFSSQTAEIVGFIAGAMTTVSFFPQLIAVYQQKSAKDLSWGYLGIFTGGVIFWFTYGIMLGAMPVIVANAVTFLLLAAIMTLKVRYHR
ncbi:MAG TPA: SemiSWEET transporter [Terriglobales bacterium]|nr:SemiSWEET transporter [Terriglobales bacterium]